jgi:hypothetical protein
MKIKKEVVKMNKSVIAMISIVSVTSYFFSCGINMPKIEYHDPGFMK